MKKRQCFAGEFKAKIALLALKGELTIAQISSQYKVDSTQIMRWKKELLEGARDVFNKKRNTELEQKQEEIDILYKQVGKLTVKCDFLREKLFP